MTGLTSDQTFRLSIWRTYFVANEWNELQSLRKTSISFLLLCVLFFYYVAGAESLTYSNPKHNAYGVLDILVGSCSHGLCRRVLLPESPFTALCNLRTAVSARRSWTVCKDIVLNAQHSF